MKKKNTFLKILNWLKDAGLKALVILLVVVAGFYAYGAINWPTGEPNPTTGVVGIFVGYTDTSFINSQSYSAVNDWCANENVITPDGTVNGLGAHVCTPDEMLNSYNHMTAGSPIHDDNYAGPATLWVNSGPPGYTANANDCKGWSAITSPSDNPNFGTVWNFSEKYGGLLHCRTGKQFACCK